MMRQRIQSIAVYGAGSWGTALALQLARNGLDVLLWDISPEHVDNINRQHENAHYLPGIPFPDNLRCSSDLQAVAAFSDYHLVVVPSHVFRGMLKNLAPLLTEKDAVIWATKGLELDTGKLLHQVLEEELPQCPAYGVVSGPTFAAEVARGLPTAMTVAANEPALAQRVVEAFSAANYRAYISADVMGVELGGALKNVLAIAAGISDGLGFGANARVAIVTRGLAEIMRLGVKIGAQPETLMGLAGVGDLILTCTDDQSRNRRLGLALGQGKGLDEAIADIGQAVEGAKSALSIGKLAEYAGVEMPICQQVYRILYEQLPPRQAVDELLSRDLKAEF
ncbi:NAD(P)H-dependent glycerol-3-phosphate dehydrogenase [Thiothrix lacustris]|uniref:Glycerol-3-phosphate dehydrogenase [NAD(P)+] n=1 Tax=Thiothrix lacustris TaxID=525917 RepID=A0ABY9MPQ0_9GAMM|nr:NAD(P)H-dependent glycerol-3-phosphate dehydrogenase [Thiothrix lacustris]WML89360.1 NAD(P)H-dependent glycerol-3-phosphate dehydrogenase [Thiothrix lacustris]WMP15992.1 NAD(P)H-dependent glycerol-3-phosphate dehydrogenase [Thiothrix lacustris]